MQPSQPSQTTTNSTSIDQTGNVTISGDYSTQQLQIILDTATVRHTSWLRHMKSLLPLRFYLITIVVITVAWTLVKTVPTTTPTTTTPTTTTQQE